MSYLPVALHNS